MKTTLTLICNVMCYNGSLNIEIFDDNDSIYVGQNLTEGPLRIDCAINWPTVVNIVTSNREDHDTMTDSDGIILKDKAIEVTNILINNFSIHQDLIDKILICRRNGTDVDTNENWWSFNGNVKIIFDQPTPMRYMLSLKNEFDINQSRQAAHG
jgi:hypothetical protein